MATRSFTLTNQLVAVTNTPLVGLTITATLIVPGSVAAIDTDSKGVVPDTVSVVTDNTGTYSFQLLYPGDITPYGCVYEIVEGSNTILSPVGFSYSSSISTWSWYGGGGASGTLQMTLKLVLGNDNPVSGRYVHVTPQTNTIAPDSSDLSVSKSIDTLLDGTGLATFYLWPSSVLSPTTLYSAWIDGESTRFSFTVPASPTGYQGAYASGTAYYVHDGTAYQGPYVAGKTAPDVVLYGGLYYVCTANTTGHVPTNTSYWSPWGGEPITWHLQPFGSNAALNFLPSQIAHDSGLSAPPSGAPYSSPTTLANDLENLQYADSIKVPLAGGTMTGELVVPDLKVVGLTGAANTSRYVGATAGGAPTTGTWDVGDWTIDLSGDIWICVVAGTPGTWYDLYVALNITDGTNTLYGVSNVTFQNMTLTGTYDAAVLTPKTASSPLVTAASAFVFLSNGDCIGVMNK